MTSASAEHTKAEQQWYDAIYRSDREFASSQIREGFLCESERYFLERLKTLSVSGVRALEIGCGSGAHAILAAQAGARLVAIDVSPEAIKLAKRNALIAGVSDYITFMVGDVELLEDKLGEFDLVIDHEVFSSLDLNRFLPICGRVLKSGGTLLGIECLGHNPIFNFNRIVKSWIGRRTRWAAKHVMTAEDLAQIESMAVRKSMRSFHLVEMLGWPISRAFPRQYSRYIRPLLIAADSFLFKWLALRKFAFKIVFEFVV